MFPSLQLRPYVKDDASEMYAAVRESMMDLSLWMPWCHAAYTLAEAKTWIRETYQRRKDGTSYDFVILDAQGRYVGACGLNQINALHRVANLGYWVRSSRAGQGFAPGAVQALAAWAFANTTLQRLEIVVAVGNLRSQRVAEKACAQRDALLRKRLTLHDTSGDALLYSIVRPD